ncbi:MAG: OmpA family protein [Hyphomicrobiaceae bacterium]
MDELGQPDQLRHTPGDVTRLKSLLFRNEQRAISAIREQVEAHHDRIGSDEDLRRSVATILSGALYDARVDKPREVAEAIAPLLVEGIKREIKNSRDEMVDALYPIMGRLVSAYVGSAVSEMMEQTNRRLESGLSGRFLYLRAKSLMTGTPYADLVMAEAQQFRIDELMLIRRGSGLLVDHLKLDLADEIQGTPAQDSSALMSGVVAAIHDFAQEAFSKRRNTLRSVDMGGQTIYLRATSGLIFAVVGSGHASRKFERALDTELLRVLEERSDDILLLSDDETKAAPKILPIVADRLMAVQQQAANKKPVLAIFLVGLIGLAIAGYAAWSMYEARQMTNLRMAVSSAIERQSAFAGYPVQIEITPDRERVRVSGFAPSAEARNALVQDLKNNVDGAALKSNFTLVPPNIRLPEPVDLSDIEDRVTAFGKTAHETRETLEGKTSAIEDRVTAFGRTAQEARETLEGRTSAIEERITAFGRTAQKTRETLEGKTSTIERRVESHIDKAVVRTDLSEIESRMAALEHEINSPSRKLRSWARRSAIFFGDGTAYRDSEKARATLRALRSRAKETGERIRVVGYADGLGPDASNQTLAEDRAKRVIDDLVRGGLDRFRLVAVGRPGQRQFSASDGPESANRRVEFEILLDGE